MNKTFYSAYTCKDNLGDLIINKMQIEEYSKYSIVYVDFTGMPDNFKNIILSQNNPNIKDFTATYGKTYRGIQFLSVIRFLKKEGFTHFTKSPGPYAVLSFPLKKFAIRLIGALGYIIAKRMGMKVFAFGIDIDYKSNQPKWLQWLNVRYFSLYNALGLRSQKNYEMCKGELKNISYVPDMAFLYPYQLSQATPKGKIAFSFREVTNKDMLVKDLKQILKTFISYGYTIDIIFQVEKDRTFSEWLANNLKELDITIVPKCIWFEDLNIYSKYEYVFSNRLHVLLLAAKHGVIPFAIISNNIKEQKISNIFNSLSFDFLTSSIGNYNCKQIENIIQNKNAIRHEINHCIEYQRQICIKFIKDFFNPNR